MYDYRHINHEKRTQSHFCIFTQKTMRYLRYYITFREAKMIKGFKMKLYPGMEEEYEKRHNELWPEMQDMIHEHGGKNYTIFLDKETLTLFGYIEIEDEELWAKGADTAINRKWWDFMAPIMETNPDNSPVSVDLKTVFHLD